jgi:hypothetical protein
MLWVQYLFSSRVKCSHMTTQGSSFGHHNTMEQRPHSNGGLQGICIVSSVKRRLKHSREIKQCTHAERQLYWCCVQKSHGSTPCTSSRIYAFSSSVDLRSHIPLKSSEDILLTGMFVVVTFASNEGLDWLTHARGGWRVITTLQQAEWGKPSCSVIP